MLSRGTSTCKGPDAEIRNGKKASQLEWEWQSEVRLERRAGARLLQVITRSLNLILTKHNGQHNGVCWAGPWHDLTYVFKRLLCPPCSGWISAGKTTMYATHSIWRTISVQWTRSIHHYPQCHTHKGLPMSIPVQEVCSLASWVQALSSYLLCIVMATAQPTDKLSGGKPSPLAGYSNNPGAMVGRGGTGAVEWGPSVKCWVAPDILFKHSFAFAQSPP